MKKLITILGLLLLVSCGKSIDSEVLERCINGDCDGEEITLETEAETNQEQNERLDDLENNQEEEEVDFTVTPDALLDILNIGRWSSDSDKNTTDEIAFTKKLVSNWAGQSIYRQMETLHFNEDLTEVRKTVYVEQKYWQVENNAYVVVWRLKTNITTTTTWLSVGTENTNDVQLLDDGNMIINDTHQAVTYR